MFGIPLSLYIITWVTGLTLPLGIFWGHTLQQYIGYWGMYIGTIMNLVGALLVILGWKKIHHHYWNKEQEKGNLVTNGIYAHIRHPQYTGFLLITFGLLIHWATLPLLVMWPILVFQYYRLAKREEGELEKQFGTEYAQYKKKTSMFIPRLRVAI
jgi:protein-S-isoprenylcysteine O-methyltransferase Ste14